MKIRASHILVKTEEEAKKLLEEIKKIIERGNYTVITDDKLQPILGGTSYQQREYSLGEILAELAENSNSEGNWRKLKPLYIQPPPGL